LDSFLKLVTGNRLTSNLGLAMDGDFAYRYPQQQSREYGYVEIPLKEIYNPSEETVLAKGVRNQYLQIIPACRVNVRGRCRFQVVPNPALYHYGMVQAPFYLEADEGVIRPSFYIQLRKDFDPSDIDWAIRIYMISG
jgi:hypothetical protein